MQRIATSFKKASIITTTRNVVWIRFQCFENSLGWERNCICVDYCSESVLRGDERFVDAVDQSEYLNSPHAWDKFCPKKYAHSFDVFLFARSIVL